MLTDNRNYNDIRMRVKYSYLKQGLLGTTHASKTLVPSNYGDERSNLSNVSGEHAVFCSGVSCAASAICSLL